MALNAGVNLAYAGFQHVTQRRTMSGQDAPPFWIPASGEDDGMERKGARSSAIDVYDGFAAKLASTARRSSNTKQSPV